MSHSSLFGRVIGLVLASLLLQPFAVAADEVETLPFSGLSFSEPERHFSATQECVAPEAEMKRNHMNYILHQRDKTMHEGIRTRQYALEECVNCHATKDENGEWLSIKGPNQFCSSCHTYASVKIDCFQCHASKPVRESTLKTPASSKAFEHTDKKMSEANLHILASEGQLQ
jgi:hypothetical protein